MGQKQAHDNGYLAAIVDYEKEIQEWRLEVERLHGICENARRLTVHCQREVETDMAVRTDTPIPNWLADWLTKIQDELAKAVRAQVCQAQKQRYRTVGEWKE